MSKNQVWKKEYDLSRKRNKKLIIRCTEEERELLPKLASKKNMTQIDLLLYLIKEEIKREENK